MAAGNIIKKIILTGGGTGGSVAPLLSIAENLKASEKRGEADYIFYFLWIGTKSGPEIEMVKENAIDYISIHSGKWRRYFSWQNFIDVFRVIFGFFESFYQILLWQPDLIISAGSFVSVPVVWAGWLLGKPVLIHQQDFIPGLANKLMAPLAKVITVTFETSLKDYGAKSVWTGNLLRSEYNKQVPEKNLTKKNLGLSENMPVVLILGGGTGSFAINQLISEAAKSLTDFCQIILVSGFNKNSQFIFPKNNFKLFEFLSTNQMSEVYAVSDIVLTRCGMGVLSELSFLGKPVILIPLPDSHQEFNASIFMDKKAAIVLKQKSLTPELLNAEIKKLLKQDNLRSELSKNIKEVIKIDKDKKIIDIINNLIK